ncbi:hypothetical protein B0H10DRAFT_2085397 [Mycena sp. CBHHK59/15]|nr:hypothetical protein B0H10DRAFT_2085397 [Mycena sp. CBHHK59/15]
MCTYHLPVSFCVQSFFAWRIYTLKPNRVVLCISGVIVSVAIIQCVASIIESASRIYPKHYIWLSGTLVADVLITASMVGVLWGVKTSSSHFESTDRMIMRLIVLSIEVGALTTIVAGAELAISNLFPQYFLYEVPAFILGKLSNNSLLVSLNARGYVRGAVNTTIGNNSFGANSNTIQLRVPRSALSETQAGTHSGIHITKDTITQDDGYLDRKATHETQV